MQPGDFRYLYGPVASWRIGRSLGIDPVAGAEKSCSFDCVYCQIGRTRQVTLCRREYVSVTDLLRELSTLPPVTVDYLTFAGTGEPTLAANLDVLIRAVRGLRTEKIAVITNASLMHRQEVRHALALADLVLVKLDAADDATLHAVNRPAAGLTMQQVRDGILAFRDEYHGALAMQIMFIEENRHAAEQLATLACAFRPDEIQINTPLRPCAVKPLDRWVLKGITTTFKNICTPHGITVRSVYEAAVRRKTRAISSAATLRRRGKPV